MTCLIVDDLDVTCLIDDDLDLTCLILDDLDLTCLIDDDLDLTCLIVDDLHMTCLIVDDLDLTGLIVDDPDVTCLIVDDPDAKCLIVDDLDLTCLIVDDLDVMPQHIHEGSLEEDAQEPHHEAQDQGPAHKPCTQELMLHLEKKWPTKKGIWSPDDYFLKDLKIKYIFSVHELIVQFLAETSFLRRVSGRIFTIGKLFHRSKQILYSECSS